MNDNKIEIIKSILRCDLCDEEKIILIQKYLYGNMKAEEVISVVEEHMEY